MVSALSHVRNAPTQLVLKWDKTEVDDKGTLFLVGVMLAAGYIKNH